MITDATIRRWCGPEWRIGASRRTRAAAVIAELQARHESGSPLNAKEFPELGKVSLINGQVQSSRFGNLSFLKSVNELNIKKITPAEKKAYEFFRDRYQSHWSKYFDPISAKLSIHEGKIEGVILPQSWLPLWAQVHSAGWGNRFPCTWTNLLFSRICKKLFVERA